jgi:hypothetical protein
MLIRSIVLILSFLLCQNLYGAGPACFNYKSLEHVGPAACANRTLLNYNHALIAAQNVAIPVLAHGAYQLGVSNIRLLAMPTAWQHGVFALVGGGLNILEACLMAVEREGIGITVDFQHRWVINAIVAGIPLAVIGAAFPCGPAAMIDYLNRALAGGGYRPVILATTLYRLRHNLPPNYLALAVGGAADTVLIHIQEPRRVSKNGKELSYNAIPNIPGYFTLKDMIDAQFNMLALPLPHSAHILSADLLQLN